MTKTYGVPYMGSKNKIAKWLVDKLPPSEVFVDIFAGGCAVTHAAIESGKYQEYIVNDIGDAPNIFIDSINGNYKNETRWISREDFEKLKDVNSYVKYCWSFGNTGQTYLYGKELEPWKKALHYARVFGDFSLLKDMGIDTTDASRQWVKDHENDVKQAYIKWYMLKYFNVTMTPDEYGKTLEADIKAESERLRQYLRASLEQAGLKQSDVDKRLGTHMAGHYFGKSQWCFPTREEYNKMSEFMPLNPYDEVYGTSSLLQAMQSLQNLPNLGRLQSLESLGRLERLQSMERLQSQQQSITVTHKDYREVQHERASFYYADPPYRGTKGYGQEFDFDAFDEWLETVDKPVIVSEYTQPQHTVEVANIEKRVLIDTKNSSKRTERLFIQDRFYEWYKEAMKL